MNSNKSKQTAMAKLPDVLQELLGQIDQQRLTGEYVLQFTAKEGSVLPDSVSVTFKRKPFLGKPNSETQRHESPGSVS